MKIRLAISSGMAASVIALMCSTATAQDIPRLSNGKPDFSGVWDHPRVADVTRDGNTCGGGTRGCTQKGSGELSFTAEGAKRWNGPRIDFTAYCLPWGYLRSSQVEYPIEIVQRPERLAFLYESNNVFHVVHTDGSDHPKDLEPTWM